MKTILTPRMLALVLVLASAGWLRADSPAANVPGRPSCYVVSVGLDNYKEQAHLEGCRNDARNAVTAFRVQKGTMYAAVSARTLLDGEATRADVAREWGALTKRGRAGDTMVLFLSGHGGNDNGNWFFCTFDATFGQRDILEPADVMASQGKKVVIVVDACFVGQLRENAKTLLDKYRDPKGGGIILMLSSKADQESAALGNFSAFAKAFVDSAEGSADGNKDGKITLAEMKSYSFKRTHDLLRQAHNNAKQDAVVAWSRSMTGDTTFAVTPRSRVFRGKETLGGYGAISFRCYADGTVQMLDNDGMTEGQWKQANGVMTFRFGAITYTGRVAGNAIAGTAANGSNRWTFSVRS
jgi:Caspase domain